MTPSPKSDEPVDSPRSTRWPWVGMVLAVIAVGVVVLLTRGDGHGRQEAVAPLVEASTVLARLDSFPSTVVALGVVIQGPGTLARPAAPAPTRVTRVRVSEGESVVEGQALVELDKTVFEARVDETEASLASAREAHGRQERLVAEGIAPRRDLEAAAAELARARAAATEARRLRDLATVRSPIGGVVTSVFVALGEPVDGNQPLAEVMNSSELAVRFSVSPDDAARIRPGQEVVLEASRRSGRDMSDSMPPRGRGTVTGVSAAVAAGSGGVAVRAIIASGTAPLRSGETVTGRIIVGVRPDAVVVPLSALVGGDDGIHVFVVDENGVAHRTPVTVGERSRSAVEVLSGLQGGDRIVAEGAYAVTDSARISGDAP